MQKQIFNTLKQINKAQKLQIRSFKNFASIIRYTEDHEWVKLDTETQIAQVGITEHAQNELGDIVHLEFPEVGESFEKGDVLGSIESVKMAADIISPISGEVVENNQAVEDDITLVNQDAETNWISALKVSSQDEFDTLFSAEDYKKFLEEQ